MKLKMKVVNTSSLAYRTGAGTNYPSKGSYKKGETFIATASKKLTQNTWYKNSKTGYWASGKYLQKVEDLEKNKADTKVTIKVSQKPTDNIGITALAGIDPDKAKVVSGVGTGGAVGVITASRKIEENKSSASKSTSNNYVSRKKKKLTPTKKEPEKEVWKWTESFKNGLSSFNTKDFTIRTEFLDKAIKNVKKELSIEATNGKSFYYNTHHNFNRFKIPDVENALPKTVAYVFFTRPNLNVLDESGKKLNYMTANLPEFYQIHQSDPSVLKALTRKFNSKHRFHPYLSNCALSFSLDDENIEVDDEVGEGLTGHKVVYGGLDTKSKTAGEFRITFSENNRLQTYKTIKIWEYYISCVYSGLISPYRKYITGRELDYAASCYYILCDASIDNRILFWSKYYGVFPKNSPSSSLSWTAGQMMGFPKYDISFAYSFKEDFTPLALAEFNELSGDDTEYRLGYNDSTLTVSNTWVGAPFIETVSTSSEYNFYLRFRDTTKK